MYWYEVCMYWYEHVLRRADGSVLRRVLEVDVEG